MSVDRLFPLQKAIPSDVFKTITADEWREMFPPEDWLEFEAKFGYSPENASQLSDDAKLTLLEFAAADRFPAPDVSGLEMDSHRPKYSGSEDAFLPEAYWATEPVSTEDRRSLIARGYDEIRDADAFSVWPVVKTINGVNHAVQIPTKYVRQYKAKHGKLPPNVYSIREEKAPQTEHAKLKEQIEREQLRDSVVEERKLTPDWIQEIRNEIKTVDDYPAWAWKGTVCERFADKCGEGNLIPRSWFFESYKTILGAIVRDRLALEDDPDENPRFYSILLSLVAGMGKSKPVSWAVEMFESLNLLYDINPKFRRIGAHAESFGSQRGMINSFDEHASVLQLYDELSVPVEKFSIQGSGQSFIGVLNELYESNRPPQSKIAGSKKRPDSAPKKVFNSILACTVESKWNTMWAKADAQDGGLAQRVNTTASDLIKKVPKLKKPDLVEVAVETGKLVLPLEQQRCVVTYTAEADAMFEEWFYDFEQHTEDATDDSKGRINGIARRNAILIAYMLAPIVEYKAPRPEINLEANAQAEAVELQEASPEVRYIECDAEVMRRAIALAEYEFIVRAEKTIVTGRSEWALCENLIRKWMRKLGRCSRSTLYSRAHLDDFGSKCVAASLEQIQFDGDIRICRDEESKKLGRKAEIIIWTGDPQ